MSLPNTDFPELTYGYVFDQLITLRGDDSDAGDDPNVTPATHVQITFSHIGDTRRMSSPNPLRALSEPVKASIDAEGYLKSPGGGRGVKLVTGYYRVQYSAHLPEHDIVVTEEHTQANPCWLSELAPPTSAPPTPSQYLDLSTQITQLWDAVNASGGGGGGGDGLSAYQIAVANGFVGTVSAWLASLKGEPGAPGPSAYQVAVSNGFVGSQSAWLNSLKGEQGDPGVSYLALAPGAPVPGGTPAGTLIFREQA